MRQDCVGFFRIHKKHGSGSWSFSNIFFFFFILIKKVPVPNISFQVSFEELSSIDNKFGL